MTIRVVIADDQAMVREAFSVLLDAQPDIEVITTAVDGLEAVAKAEELRPDVIVMDIRMPGLNGIDATRQITAQADLPTKILVLTTFNLDEYVYEALRRRRQRISPQRRLGSPTGRSRTHRVRRRGSPVPRDHQAAHHGVLPPEQL